MFETCRRRRVVRSGIGGSGIECRRITPERDAPAHTVQHTSTRRGLLRPPSHPVQPPSPATASHAGAVPCACPRGAGEDEIRRKRAPLRLTFRLWRIRRGFPKNLCVLSAPGEDLESMFVERAVRGLGCGCGGPRRVNLPAHWRANCPGSSALKRLPARSVVVSVADESLRGVSEAAMNRRDLRRCEWIATAGLDALYDAAVGITDVECAIAETGSIVVRSSAGTSRGGFLVPTDAYRTGAVKPDCARSD